MTTEEKIKIMQASLEGKEIEVALQRDPSYWFLTETPRWNWEAYVYRIKPEQPKPKYRPFKNIDEAFQATKERKEGAEAMVEKIRKVLNGADVIEMPSEEDITENIFNTTGDVVGREGEITVSHCMKTTRIVVEWIKSKIVG